MREVLAEWRGAVQQAAERLAAVPDEEARRRPAPGKWSAKEELGHLVDSASNNHGRFVRAAGSDDFVFPGYAQDEWVALERYQEADWADLVELFRTLNLHVAHVVEGLPEEALTRLRRRHNLHQIAWRPVPEDQPTTLEYFVRDYVGHLRYHLDRVLARVGG